MQRVKKKKSKLPSWVESTATLHKWRRVYGVFMMTGAICQLVIVDLNDPIGVSLQKPLKISREEGTITGVFLLNASQIKGRNAQKPYYIVAVYDKAAKAFVYQIEGQLLPMVLGDKAIHFIVGEERNRVRDQLTVTK